MTIASEIDFELKTAHDTSMAVRDGLKNIKAFVSEVRGSIKKSR